MRHRVGSATPPRTDSYGYTYRDTDGYAYSNATPNADAHARAYVDAPSPVDARTHPHRNNSAIKWIKWGLERRLGLGTDFKTQGYLQADFQADVPAHIKADVPAHIKAKAPH